MAQRIQAPDGSVIEFPDGMSDAEIANVMRREYGGKDTRRTSQGLGFMQGVTTVLDKVPPAPTNFIPGLDARPAARKNREDLGSYFAKREGTERPGEIGKYAGQVLATLPVAAVTKNPWAAGGAQGALVSEREGLGGVAADAAMGAAAGGVIGKATGAVADAIAPVVRPAVQKLREAGVRMTPGQIRGGKSLTREDKRMSTPGVGDRIAADRRAGIEDLNRATINRALFPLGVRLPDNVRTGHEAVEFMQEAAGRAYDRIMPNLKLTPDKRLIVGLRNGWRIAQQLPDQQQQVFQRIIEANLGGNLAGRSLAVALRDIRKAASGYGRSGTEAERQLGEALGEVDDALRSSLVAQNPKHAKALSSANAAYKNTMVVNAAAKNADGGVFNTGQLKAGVRQADRTKGKRATAAGRAPMQDLSEAAREVLPARTPNSGTADRLNARSAVRRAKGLLDSLGYEADKKLSELALIPRSAEAQKIAGLLRDNRVAISGLFGPIGVGLSGALGSRD